jgi:O-antigen/teichoic acid export membrane protein
VLGNAGMLLGGRGANAVLGLAYMAVSGRALGARELGVLVLIHAFAQTVGDLIKFQSWQTVLRYGAGPAAAGERAPFQAVLRFCLRLDLISAVLGLGVGAAGAFLFADRLGWGPGRAPAAALYMGVILVMVSATPTGLMRLFDRFQPLAAQTALVGLVRLVGCLLAAGLHAGLEGFLLAWAAGQVAGFLYLTASTARELKGRGLLDGYLTGPRHPSPEGAWRFSWNANLSAALDVAMSHAATLMVGWVLGPAPAAFWRIGRQVADAIAKPARLLAAALYPELARLREAGERSAMRRLALSTGLAAGGTVGALLLVSALAGPWLLRLVMGEAFASAAAVMTWQVAAVAVGALALPLEPMLMTQGRAGEVVRVQILVGAVFLLVFPSLIRRAGLEAGGAALVAGETALALGWLAAVLRGRRARA